MNKIFKTFMVLALLLVGTSLVSAASFDISKVEVDGIVAYSTGDAIYAQRGDDLTVSVWIQGTAHSDNVRVKAYIGGYEYDDVVDRSEIFEVENNVDYRKTLHLELPEDMEASDDYTLHVKVYDDDDEIGNTYRLRLQEKRHLLKIQDILVRPQEIEAGRPIFTTVRVENLGDKKEEDIKVTVSIPELGVSASDYIDELVSVEDPENDEEDSASSNEIFFRIPEDAKTGDYTLKVEVEYNRGHEVLTQTKKIHVEGISAAAIDTTSTISIDSTSKTVVAGKELAFKIMIANLGKEPIVYSAEVAGEKLFATSRVEPTIITVQPGSTGELYAYLTTKKDASGSNAFTIKVKSGTTIVKEFNTRVDFESKLEGLKNALIIGFGVLVILLIILGLIIAFTRMRGGEEPSEEGQSYY